MPNNINVGVTVDVADLTAKRAVMSAELSAAQKDLREFANTARTSGMTDELRANMLEAGAAVAKVRAEVAELTAEIKVLGKESVTGFAAFRQGVAEAAETAQGLKESLLGIGEAMVAFFAVEQIAEFAKGMAETAAQISKAAIALGTTTGDIQEQKATAAGLDIPFDSLEAAVLRSSRALTQAREGSKQASEAFKLLGIDIHTSVTPVDLLKEEIAGLQNIPDQTTRIGVAFQVFGKNLLPLAPLLGLTKEQMAELNQEFATYGIRNDDAESKGLALAESMDTNHIAMQGLGEVMMSALAPTLTEIVDGINKLIAGFIQSYNSGGAAKIVMDAFAISLKVAAGTVAVLATLFVVAIDTIKGAITAAQATWQMLVDEFKGRAQETADAMIGLGKVIYDSLTNNVIQAANDMRAGWAQMQADAAKTAAAVAKDAAAMRQAFMAGGGSEAGQAISGGVGYVKSLFGPDAKVKLGGGGGGGAPPDLNSKKGKKDNPVKDDDKELQLLEAWQTVADQVAGIQDNMLQLEIAFWARKAQAAVQGSAEWVNAVLKGKSATDQQANDEVRSIQETVDKEIEAHRKALDAQKQFVDEAVKYVEQGLTKEVDGHKRALEEETKGYRQLTSIVGPVVNTFTSGLLKMAEGAQSFKQLMLNIGQSILSDFISRVINPMVEKWLWSETEKVLATEQGQAILQALGLRDMALAIANDAKKVASTISTEAAKNTAKAAGAATGVAIGRTANAAMTTTDAATAAKGAYASASQVPVVGWILGPIAAAAAFAGVEAFAAGGMDVGNWAPVTQLHPQEMVLPARIANPVRAMADKFNGAENAGPWGGDGGGGDIHHHHWNVSTLEGASLYRAITNNPNEFGRAMTAIVRGRNGKGFGAPA